GSRKTVSGSNRRSPPRWPGSRSASTKWRSLTTAGPMPREKKSAGATVSGRCGASSNIRSEEHTSELQSRENLVCRLLLEKNNRRDHQTSVRPTRECSSRESNQLSPGRLPSPPFRHEAARAAHRPQTRSPNHHSPSPTPTL